VRSGEQLQRLKRYNTGRRHKDDRGGQRRLRDFALEESNEHENGEQRPEENDFNGAVGLRIGVARRIAAGKIGERRNLQGIE
jgi:hypothetical protein